MRKASKKTIASNLASYVQWREKVEGRLSAINQDGAKIIREWLDDLRGRIESGDINVCSQALAQSIARALNDFESGRYVGVTSTGGFICS